MKEDIVLSRAEVVTGQGGLPKVCIQNEAACAEICLMAAHVLSYHANGQEDVFFVSEQSSFGQTGPAIRGGVPVCWPWFGPPNREELPNATTSHGFVRQFIWEYLGSRCVSARRTDVTFVLRDSPESRAIWPYSFELRMNVGVGDTLEMNLETSNTGNMPFTYAQALHSYFSIGDISQTRIEGFDGLEFIDKAPANPPAPNPQRGDIAITEETDRIYLGHSGSAVIVDPAKRRKITIAKSGSNTSVVWNPWIAKAHRMPDFGDEEFHRMLCVETCNVADDAVSLAPGESHSLAATIAVCPM